MSFAHGWIEIASQMSSLRKADAILPASRHGRRSTTHRSAVRIARSRDGALVPVAAELGFLVALFRYSNAMIVLLAIAFAASFGRG